MKPVATATTRPYGLIVIAGLAACTPSTSTPPVGHPTPTDGSNAGSAAPLAPGELARSDTSSVMLEATGPCEPDAACEAKLVLHALGGYHVNAEYPTKFVAAPESTAVEGTGEFAPAETTGVLTLRFRRTSEPAQIRGQFRFAVCSADICKIEQPTIAFAVPAS
jgi:hypothetical protein